MARANIETTDNLPTGQTKINDNFVEVYADVATNAAAISSNTSAIAGKADASHNHDATYAAIDVLDDLVSSAANNTLTGAPSFWSGTQANYDLLTPDNNTFHFIEE